MKKSFITVEIFCLILLLFNVFLISINPLNKLYEPTITNESLDPFCGDWIYADGSKANLYKLSAQQMDPSDGSITAYHKLFPNDRDQTLMFRSKGLNFSVSLGGNVVYYYFPKQVMSSGKSYGNAFNFIPLPHSDFERMLEIKIYPIHDDFSGLIDYIYIGGTGHYIRNFITVNLLSFSLSMLTVVLGAIILIISSLIKLQATSAEMRSFALLSIMVGIFSSFSTMIPELLFGYSTFFHSIDYLFLIFFPYPIIRYLCSILNIKTFYSKLICSIVIIDYLVLCALNYLGISDFHETHMIPYLVIFVTILLIFVLIIYNRKNIHFKKGVLTSYSVLIGFAVTMASVLIDILRYLIRSGLYDYTIFTRIGFFIFLMLALTKYISIIQQETKLASTNQIYRDLAFKDILTGLENRAAFSEEETRLGNQLSEGYITEILCCQLDLNNLKLANDRYGHSVGDNLLKSAAEIIKEAFKDEGNFYRIGGDEFIVFICGDDSEIRYNRCLKIMFDLENESEYEGSLPIPISFAYGSAVYRRSDYKELPKNGIKVLEKIEREADLAMYEQKKIMKQNAEAYDL